VRALTAVKAGAWASTIFDVPPSTSQEMAGDSSQSGGGGCAASGRAVGQGSVMNTIRLPSLFAPEPFAFDDAFRSFMRPLRWETTSEMPQIPMDVVEMDDAYVVTAVIPGVKKEDIHVEIEGRQVMITTDYKKPVYEKKDVRFLRGELNYGFASRVFSLGCEIDRDKAVAKYLDGMLTLTLPKAMPVHGEALRIE
jgi:HSP20 family protein